MVYTIDTLPHNVVFGATDVAEVIQNVRTIITTRKGTVPLDREFGLDVSFLDDPFPSAHAMVQNEIFQKIKRYEPRAVVKKIEFNNSPLAGKLAPSVTIEVNL